MSEEPVELSTPDSIIPAGPTAAAPDEKAPQRASGGCLQGGLLAFLDFWILAAVVTAAIFTWLAEQTLTNAHQADDRRWMIMLALGLAVLVPSALAWASAKASSNRRFYRAYALAGLFVMLLAPARLAGLTKAYLTALLLILGMLIFLLLARLLRASGPLRPARAGFYGLGLAVLIGGLIGLPWLIWGAFGAPAEIVLNLLVALLFGVSVARLLPGIFTSLPDGSHEPPVRVDGVDAFAPQPRSGAAVILEGKVTGFVLLLMGASLGVNGSLIVLAFMLPPLGAVLAWLYRRFHADRLFDGFTFANLEQDDSEPGLYRLPANAPVLVDNRGTLGLLAGLVVFWPLALLDADELAASASFGLVELIQWTALAVLLSVLVAFGVGALLGMLRNRLHPERPGWRVNMAAAVVCLAAVGLYVFVGQPGLHGDRLFVILKQQADLSAAAQVEDPKQRRTAVYDLLVQHANQTQAGLRQAFDTWGIPYRAYYLENALEVQAGPLVRLWLLNRPEVDRVLESPLLRPLAAPAAPSAGFAAAPDEPPWNLTLIGAERVWRELGVTGAGILIGQSDSGVQGSHPELADGYRGRAVGPDYNWYDPWNNTREPVDMGGHGTHTLGTVLGNRVGVAPDAQWIGCVNLARNLASPSYYLDCLQFSLAPFPQGGDALRDGLPDLGAHVLNNSWGCPPMEGCDPTALLPAVSALRAAGVFVVVSAGNEGSDICGTLADPIAIYDQVYSVGAVDASRALASFSSIGPVSVDGSQRVKPDIAAPGVRVLSAYPGSTYETASGTSMAGPHVAGVVALMWSANPALIGDIERTEQILNETAAPYIGPLPACVPPGTPNAATGHGILDAYQAVRRAMGRD